jgi:hypothetical protein
VRSMKSSMVMALRTMVMFLCLCAVPAAAVFTTGSWPRVQAKLEEVRNELYATLRPANSSAPSTGSPAVIEPLALAKPSAPVATGGPSSGSRTPVPDPTKTAAATNATATSSMASEHRPTEEPQRLADLPVTPTSAQPLSPTSSAYIDPLTRPAGYLSEIPAKPARSAPIAADRSEWIQHRLQTLGAAWYRLESLSAGGETYRFQCKMTSPANPNYVRYFEATSGEPLRSMQHVLDQIDAWVASRELAGR